jgi:hypothetical protein
LNRTGVIDRMIMIMSEKSWTQERGKEEEEGGGEEEAGDNDDDYDDDHSTTMMRRRRRQVLTFRILCSTKRTSFK